MVLSRWSPAEISKSHTKKSFFPLKKPSNMGRKKGRRRKSLKTNGFHMNELKESEIFCEPQAANFNRAIEAVPAENFDGRIENLPEHILLQIFKHTDGETMAKLRKVSRKFNEVVMENVKMLPKIEIRDVTLSARKLVTQATSTDCLVLSYDKCTSREKWVRFSKYLPAFDSNSAEIFQNQRKKLLDSEGLSKLWNFAISGFFLLDKLYFNETLIDTLIDLRFCIEELKIVYSELYDISVEKMVRFLENAKPVEFSMLNCDFPSNFITDRLIKSLENARQLTIVPRGPIHCGSVTDRSLYYLKNNHNGAEMPNAVDFGLQFSTNITENGLCQLLEQWINTEADTLSAARNNQYESTYNLGLIKSTKAKLAKAMEELPVTVSWDPEAPLMGSIEVIKEYPADFDLSLIINFRLR